MDEILILGAGFGALTAVREIRKQKLDVRIKLVAPEPIFEYLPSAIWIPYDMRKLEDLRISLDKFFQKHDVEFIRGQVTAVKARDKKVILAASKIDFDYLIIASGARHIKKIPGITQHAIIPCAGLKAAQSYRQKLQNMQGGTIAFGFGSNPKEPAAMRGGPVFEFLFGTDSYLRRKKIRDNFKLIFFSPAPQPGKRLGAKTVARLLKRMQQHNIKTYLGSKILEFAADKVVTEKTEFNADVILFNPGMTGPDWLGESDFELSAGGFIKADSHARASGMRDIFVAGDAGSFPGPDWAPKQAHMADLQVICAVKNIKAQINNKPATETFKTELACIIDSNDSGVLVYRTETRNFMFKSRLLHLAKLGFEKYYLNKIIS